ncbi:MAG: hypothetical protein JXQ71_11840 [Verrucomicrobia bacterium]|nr:hypothetical protein [Verrucomicrobiota bacterium]
MCDSSDPPLEALIDRKLRELPELEAPPTLAPRVMAALQTRARAWWCRAWWDWPAAAKAAFIAVALALGGLLGGGSWVLNQNVQMLSRQWADKLPSAPPIEEALWAWIGQLWTHAGSISQPVWLTLLGGLAMAYLFCLGLGSVFVRVALHRRSDRH